MNNSSNSQTCMEMDQPVGQFRIVNGSVLTTIGLLGTLLSSTVIYLLLYRRVRLAKCQSLFIINLSVSDVLVSILGVFRGLGIIDSKFVGVVNNTATPYCTVYTLLLNSFGYSNVVALLPLTIDRAVAVILPLQHGTIITHRTCAVMLGSVWLSIFIVLVNYLVHFKNGTMVSEHSETYHRCIFPSKSYNTENLFLIIIPFLLILLMYSFMLFIIVKTKRSCGRFLLLSTGIIGTNMMCFTPTIITNLGTIHMSYIATQVLYVTVWYLNGIFNPLIYFLSHPTTKNYFKSCFSFTKVGNNSRIHQKPLAVTNKKV
ncbi:hypothetical protein ACHWQZ_G008420 [Mnemiopsis leidyi]